MKKIMAFLRRCICNIEGKVSWRRLGLLLITISGAVLAVQASTPELHLPLQLIIGAKATTALGIYFGLAGLQDAADRKNGIK
jgi:hypothetical protein